MTSNRRVYFDHNATSPIRPAVSEAMLRAMALPGNASSVHAEGRAARAVIETAREQVAVLVGARARNVYFTSGGTEANNAVLTPNLRMGKMAEAADILILGATEHPSLLQGHRFSPENVTILPVDGNGVVDLAVLEKLLMEVPGRAVVSVHLANNETGVVQPVAEAAEIAHRHGAILHTDAVQAAGRIEIDIRKLGADVLTLSAHKIGGPKGAGAIVLGSAVVDLGGALIRGGGQERGLRSGTENVAAIAGFGIAAEESLRMLPDERMRLGELRQELESIILCRNPEAVVIGGKAERLCNTLAVAIPGQRAETMLIAFDLAGVALSSGSACSSGKVKRSHVLDAMRMDNSLSEGAIRLSLGWNSTHEDCVFFAHACESVFKGLYKRRLSMAV